MHEMPITQALLNMVLENARGRRVTDVYLQVGQMSPVVSDSVEVFFAYLSKDTLAEGARLHFKRVPLGMTCQDCRRTLDLSQWAAESAHVIMQRAFARGCDCGSKNLRVTEGVRFGLVSVDVEEVKIESPGARPL